MQNKNKEDWQRSHFRHQLSVMRTELITVVSAASPWPYLTRRCQKPSRVPLIRIDKDDNGELVTGSYPQFVGIPDPTTPEEGMPISGLPAGFGAANLALQWAK